jgi:ribosomal protein S18 acetylase RimI-like enzyme
MPAIEIRPAVSSDIPILLNLDHGYISEYVWQVDFQMADSQINVNFRQVHLPRAVHVDYPRTTKGLADDWTQRSGLLVATLDGEPVGYISMMQHMAALTTWVSDLVVSQSFRRKGIGSALVLAAQQWVAEHPGSHRLVLEMQTKNYPAISMSQKLGFDFCGFNDHHYANNDIALFFAKWIG